MAINLFDFSDLSPVSTKLMRDETKAPLLSETQKRQVNPVEPSKVIQSFLNETKTRPEYGKKREAVINMIKNNETKEFIEDTIQNKMQYIPEGPSLSEQLGTRLEKAKESSRLVSEGKQTKFEAGLQAIGQLAGATGDVIFEGIKSVTPDFVKQGFEDKFKEFASTNTGKTALSALSKGGEIYGEFKRNNPRAAANLESVVNIGTILPISKGVQATGKAAGKLASKTLDVGTAGVESAISISTGISKQSQEAIKKAPELYKMARTGTLTRESLAGNTKRQIDRRIDDLSESGKLYQQIRKGAIVANKTDLENAFLDSTSKIDMINLTKGDRAAIREVSDYIDELKGGISDDRLLGLRKKIDSTISWDKPVSTEGKIAVRAIRSKIDELAKTRIKGLAELDAIFGPEKEFLNKIKSEIYDKSGNLKDNYISRIANITGKGKETNLDRLETVIPGVGDQVRALKAFEEVKGGLDIKTGSIIRQLGSIGAGAATTGPVGAVIAFTLSNPVVAARIIEAYSTGKNIIKGSISGIADKIRVGTKLSEKEAIKAFEIFKKAETKNVEKIISNIKQEGNKFKLKK